MRDRFPHNQFRVLVVEDDAFLRMDAVDLLADLGFDAVEASGADPALAILGETDDVAILFTDIDMPGSMNGLALAVKVSETWPQVRILVTSGHHAVCAAQLPRGAAFLPKPYTPAQVEAVLGRFADELARR